MEHDSSWSSSDLATTVAKIIESMKLIPISTTKIKPFEAHFCRPLKTELSNIITKPSNKSLSYNKVKKSASDQAALRHPALHREHIWDWDTATSKRRKELAQRDNRSNQTNSNHNVKLPGKRTRPQWLKDTHTYSR